MECFFAARFRRNRTCDPRVTALCSSSGSSNRVSHASFSCSSFLSASSWRARYSGSSIKSERRTKTSLSSWNCSQSETGTFLRMVFAKSTVQHASNCDLRKNDFSLATTGDSEDLGQSPAVSHSFWVFSPALLASHTRIFSPQSNFLAINSSASCLAAPRLTSRNEIVLFSRSARFGGAKTASFSQPIDNGDLSPTQVQVPASAPCHRSIRGLSDRTV